MTFFSIIGLFLPHYSFGAVMAFAFAQVWSERMEVFYPWKDGRGRPKGFLQSITCVCIYVPVNVCVFQKVSGVIGELALTQAKR